MHITPHVFSIGVITTIACTCGVAHGQDDSANAVGIFAGHRDIGAVGHSGSVEWNSEDGSYKVTGGGANMWANVDALHYVWKKAEGDVSIAADVRFVGTGGEPHRKACLIIRQTLDADSTYADAAVHADGLTSIQYRDEKGGVTREIQSNISKPYRVRIEKVGDYVSMSIANDGEKLQPAGGACRRPVAPRRACPALR